MRLSREQKGRAGSSLIKMGILLAIGFAYYLFVRFTGLGISCPIYKLTGKLCPGCGVTRMCMALLQLDLATAFRSNVLVMALLPFGIFFGIRRWIFFVKTGSQDMDLPEKIAVYIAFALTVAFWILRNLPRFSFLAPGG